MRLSEAIKLGSMVVKEDRLYLRYEGNQPCGCVLATAMYAVGNHEWMAGQPHEVCKVWPWTAKPSGVRLEGEDINIARSLSLRHYGGESRASIAAWVAEQEMKLGVVDRVKVGVKEGESCNV
jgi:hypothetical protein